LIFGAYDAVGAIEKRSWCWAVQ